MKILALRVLIFLFLSISCAEAYKLKSDVMDGGGTKMTSSGYVLRGSVGQPTIGTATGGGYVGHIGFWHPYPTGPGVEEDSDSGDRLPRVFNLSQNYPNPVLDRTLIKYSLPRKSRVKVEVFNSAGRKSGTLVDADEEAGYHSVSWDLSGISEERFPNGVYFVRLTAGDAVLTRKMVILR